jgi:hypothetical protein
VADTMKDYPLFIYREITPMSCLAVFTIAKFRYKVNRLIFKLSFFRIRFGILEQNYTFYFFCQVFFAINPLFLFTVWKRRVTEDEIEFFRILF